MVDWIFSLAVTLLLKKKFYRPYLGRFKPNWLKFWPKVGLASLLDCYSLEKSGYLLKKNRVLVVFLVLEKTGINKVIWRFY